MTGPSIAGCRKYRTYHNPYICRGACLQYGAALHRRLVASNVKTLLRRDPSTTRSSRRT